jgi:hypothetical protein
MVGLEAAGSALPPTVVKNIADKLYEKRKSAALEIEQLVKTLKQQGKTERILDIIDGLIQYALSSQVRAGACGQWKLVSVWECAPHLDDFFTAARRLGPQGGTRCGGS